MARRTKDAPTTTKTAPQGRTKGGRPAPKGGRATPKRSQPGGHPNSRGGATTRAATPGRYTAPVSPEFRHSKPIVPIAMLTFFALGVICILLNYVSVLPGGASNWYLLAGLGLIVLGFITATRWR